MSWKLIDRPKTVAVTRKLAKQFADMEAAPHDRPLSTRRLTVYEKLMKDGKFRPVTWATAECVETGGKYRVNGKHTSTLLAAMDFLPEFYVTVEEYRCDGLEDVAQLYATFDSRMMSRTANDIYLSFAATCPEIKHLPQRVITSSATGIAYAKFGQDTYDRSQPAERAELVLEHSAFVVWFHDLLTRQGEYQDSIPGVGMKKYQHILRQGVVAAMFKTWERSPENSTKFWLEVRDETGITPEVPTRKLARFLLTTGLRNVKSGEKSSFTERAGLREIFVRCIHAWNAWRKGEPTKLQYYAKAPLPAVS